MSKDHSTTQSLLELCAGYFVCYVATGVAVKYFTEISLHPMSQLVYLFQNTAGSSLFAIVLIILLGWHKLARRAIFRPGAWPIALSGICTAVVIPTTTLMYLLPVSVMVAMVIMRGSVIVISRMVDAIQIRQGILKKRIVWEEDVAVAFALLAVGMNLMAPTGRDSKPGFLHNPTALAILGAYLTAYSVRLYIMNVYKNSAGTRYEKPDNRTYFSIEQFWATAAMFGFVILLLISAPIGGLNSEVFQPHAGAIFSGIGYGGVAFFSVFIFMFPGRSATFSAVANRLTSLTAGTVSTLLVAVLFSKNFPTSYEWGSMLWIGIATGLLIRVEVKRGQDANEKVFIPQAGVELV